MKTWKKIILSDQKMNFRCFQFTKLPFRKGWNENQSLKHKNGFILKVQHICWMSTCRLWY